MTGDRRSGRALLQRGGWLAAGVLLTVTILVGPRSDGDDAGHYILATATTGGTFYPVGVAIATLTKQLLAPEHGVSLAAISSAGSEENLKLLRNREAHFVILQGLHGAWAWSGEGRLAGQPPFEELRAVAILWPNVEHFVVRGALAGTGTIDDLATLHGHRFSIGARYSGAEGSARHLLEGLGIDADTVLDLAYLGYEGSADALQDGILAGMNTPGGAPVGAVTRALAADDDLIILAFTEDQRRRAAGPYENLWQAYTIEAGTYPNQSQPVTTIAQPNLLVVHADVPDTHVYLITRMLFEQLGFLHASHAAARQLTLEGAYTDLPMPYHDGALRYYRERGVAADNEEPMQQESTNPLLATSPLPHGAPDFARLRDEHFAPAFEQAIAEHSMAVRAIADSDAPPTFDNTIEALERSGITLARVRRVFSQLNSADTNPARQTLNRTVAPMLAAHDDAILLDQALFARVGSLHDRRDALGLDAEQRMLLERHFLRFLRAGAALPETSRERLRTINQRIAAAMAEFGDNVRDDTAAFVHLVTNQAALEGLPADLVQRANEEARARGQEGHAFTLQEPVVFAVLQHAAHRPLREAIYRAYKNRGNYANAYDNNRLAGEIAQLRAEAAQLLGYRTHADYALADAMAGTPDAVMQLLDQVWPVAVANAGREAERLQQQIDAEGGEFELAPWDWWYYAERVRLTEYAFDDGALRTYLPLERVRDGAFLLAQRLFGLRFDRRDDIPAWHPDVQVYEVTDDEARTLGLIYMDFLTRPSKRFGAWMSALQVQSGLLDQSAIVTNTLNFGPATPDAPVLLSFEQATTLFHEFGHALHGLLSDVRFPSLSGTAVARDFVELPSQLLENWLATPELLGSIGRHHQTGEPIPRPLIDQLIASRQFNEGFAATEYLASTLIDMAWYRRAAEEPAVTDAIGFEDEVTARIGLPPQILPRHRSTHFGHIFAGGYAAGYYSYLWAEVLDADVFDAFRDAGLFDRSLGQRLRDTVLARGRSVDPMDAFVGFRGRLPTPEPLLRRRGLLPPEHDDAGR